MKDPVFYTFIRQQNRSDGGINSTITIPKGLIDNNIIKPKTYYRIELQEIYNVITLTELKQYKKGNVKYDINVNIKKYKEYKLVENPIITNEKIIHILFDYPLQKPVKFEYKSNNGFKLSDILDCIYKGYNKIYAEEEEICGKTSNLPGLKYNRDFSDGPYRIYGHTLEQLYLEGFIIDKERKSIKIEVGS